MDRKTRQSPMDGQKNTPEYWNATLKCRPRHGSRLRAHPPVACLPRLVVPLCAFEQDFFLDLIFAPVESAASSPSKSDADSESRVEGDSVTADASTTAPEGGATTPADGETGAAAAAAATASEDAAVSGNMDEAAKEGEAENSAVARRERKRVYAIVWLALLFLGYGSAILLSCFEVLIVAYVFSFS